MFQGRRPEEPRYAACLAVIGDSTWLGLLGKKKCKEKPGNTPLQERRELVAGRGKRNRLIIVASKIKNINYPYLKRLNGNTEKKKESWGTEQKEGGREGGKKRKADKGGFTSEMSAKNLESLGFKKGRGGNEGGDLERKKKKENEVERGGEGIWSKKKNHQGRAQRKGRFNQVRQSGQGGGGQKKMEEF